MPATTDNPAVLAVDLDGTLIHSDLLLESVLLLLRKNPFSLLLMFSWLLSGKASLKRKVAQRVSLDPGSLAYQQELLDYVRAEHAGGRSTVLATGADQLLAGPVADYLGCFDQVVASDGITNCTGPVKVAALQSACGQRAFDYVGDSRVDLPVWQVARQVLVVSGSERFNRNLRQHLPIAKIFHNPPAGLVVWLKLAGIRQWVKNLLLFAPLLLSHLYTDNQAVLNVIAAYFSLGFCASAIYLLADLFGVPFDRVPARDRLRQQTTGRAAMVAALLAVPLLLLLSLALALLLPMQFQLLLGTYCAFTLAYSSYLSRIPVFDVLVLAGLYTLRLWAGAAALAIAMSFWLLAFSMFLFVSLALMKRFAEVREVELQEGERDQLGRGVRGYRAGDSVLLGILGAASGFCCVLVIALYIHSAAVQAHYTTLYALWLVCPLMMYWVSHMWFAAHRGEMHDDPIVFAVSDGASLFCAATLATLFVVAI